MPASYYEYIIYIYLYFQATNESRRCTMRFSLYIVIYTIYTNIYRYICLALFIYFVALIFCGNFNLVLLGGFLRVQLGSIRYDLLLLVIYAPHERMGNVAGVFFCFFFGSWIRRNADKNVEEITAGTFDLRAECEHSFISIQTYTHVHTQTPHKSLSAD